MKNENNFQTETGSSLNSPKFHMNEVLAKFRPQFTRIEQARYMNEHVLQILSDPNWLITDNYIDQKWNQIFSYILESYCRRLFIMNTQNSGVILQISRIKFSCVKQLNLSSNNIANIEGINFLRIPNIKSLVLKNNRLRNINSLRKSKWKQLQSLDLEGNYLLEWGNINSLYINCKVIDSFSIQFLNSQTLTQLEDISHLYAKFVWEFHNDQIQAKINYFYPIENFRAGPNTIIRLSQKKYEALKRKFKRKV